MQKYILLVIINLAVNSFAQELQIEGTITHNKIPQSFVNIYMIENSKGTVTNDKGYYILDGIKAGNYTVNVSGLGFKTKNIIVNTTNSSIKLDINLDVDDSYLDEIVISGTLKAVSKLKSAVPIEVYSKTFFKKNPTPSIFEALQNINGVRPQLNCNVCNTGDIHINGLEGPYTFVLIDGMPIVSGLSTVYGLTGIPKSLIERVEIVKGPASTLYGSEAVGGVINLITKSAYNAPLYSIDTFSTSWGELNADFSNKFNIGENATSLLGVNYFSYQNPIDNNKDNFTDLTLQHRVSIFNKIDFKRKSDKKLTLAGRYFYEDRWGGEMGFSNTFRGGNEVYGESIFTSRWEAFGTYELPVDENIIFQFSSNGHNQNSFYGTTSFQAKQYIGFGQLSWNKILNTKHDLLMGIAYRYSFYDDDTFATLDSDGITNNESITHLPGFFIQDEISINSMNKLLLGVRYDYNSIHGSIISPRINYKWNKSNYRDIIRLSIGNGFRVANVFTEDHAALTGAREVEFNGDLKPEKSWNINLNYVKKINTSNMLMNIDTSIFYTYFNNRILPDYESDPNKIIYSNLDGHAVSKGVSTNIDIVFSNALKALLGATLMDVSVTDSGITRQQILTEKFSGVWSISYNLLDLGILIDYTGNVYGPMRLPLLSDTDPRPEFSPWHSIQNIQLTKKLSNSWEIYGGVKNILNFTPSDDSIARSFDPFDENVSYDDNGGILATNDNPYALSFDPSYVYTSNQGIRGFLGFRHTIF